MKVVILAGGLGTRLSEESHLRPKPMVEIGGKPILWHIMKSYASYGFDDFVILGGYKAYIIKEYFANYFLHNSDATFDLQKNTVEIHQSFAESWRVTVVDTGEQTMTGGRLLRAKRYIGDDTFCMTYGDGLADIDMRALVEFHQREQKLATLTAVKPPGRFGSLHLENNQITQFIEKPEGDGNYINGGFFVLSPQVLDRIEGDDSIWEQEPLKNLARDHELTAFKHHGFWRPMDSLRDKVVLEELWNSGKAPWKNW